LYGGEGGASDLCGGGRGAHLDRAAALCGEPRNERAHLTRPTHNRLRASVWLGASLQRAEARQVCTGDGGGDASGLYGAGGGGGRVRFVREGTWTPPWCSLPWSSTPTPTASAPLYPV